MIEYNPVLIQDSHRNNERVEKEVDCNDNGTVSLKSELRGWWVSDRGGVQRSHVMGAYLYCMKLIRTSYLRRLSASLLALFPEAYQNYGDHV